MIFCTVIFGLVSFATLICSSPVGMVSDTDTASVLPIDWSKVKIEYLVPSETNDYLREIGADLKFQSTISQQRAMQGDALAERLPYQVGIALTDASRTTWCSGALISKQFVLTAAHCLDSADKAILFIGAYNIQAEDEPGRVVMSVNKNNFIIHEGWNLKDMLDDVALIKLPYNVAYSDKIQPIPLFPKEYSPIKTNTNVSGWGQNSDEGKSYFGFLQQYKSSLTSQEVCKKYYKNHMSDQHLCVTPSAQGQSDNGGPMVINVAGSKHLIGIHSYSSNVGYLVGIPNVFTDVRLYKDWIIEKTTQ